MKKFYLALLITISFLPLCAKINDRYIILPNEFQVGQEFMYEGIPYIVKGFDEEKTKSSKKLLLFLEYPIRFGFEFGKQLLKLTIKHGTDPSTESSFNAHIEERSKQFNWKFYLLALLCCKGIVINLPL